MCRLPANAVVVEAKLGLKFNVFEVLSCIFIACERMAFHQRDFPPVSADSEFGTRHMADIAADANM